MNVEEDVRVVRRVIRVIFTILVGSFVINVRKLFKDVSLERKKERKKKKRIQRQSKIKFRANPRFKKSKSGTFFPITWSA